MSQWTIARRLIAGFSAVILVTLLLGGFAFSRLLTIDYDARRIVGDALPGVTAILQMSVNTRENRALMLEHVLAETPTAKAAVESAIAERAEANNRTAKTYEATITLDGRVLFARILDAQKELRAVRENELLPLSREGKTQEALAVLNARVKPALERYMAAIEVAVKFNQDNGINWGKDLSNAVSQSKTGIIVGFLVALAVGFGVAWLIISTTNRALRGSVEELTEGAHQVASASGQVATSAQSLSQGATEQAASLEETSASMEEMASMTRQNAENSQTAASADGRGRHAASSESNAALGEHGDVDGVDPGVEPAGREDHQDDRRDRVPDQHPGAQRGRRSGARRRGGHGLRGRGRRSAQPGAALGAGRARTPRALIEESIAKRRRAATARSSRWPRRSPASPTACRKVKGLVEEVSVASRQQSQGIDQVSQAIAQMEKVTQTTAATAEESAAASEELNAQAETSMGVVGRLEALVGGAQAPATARKAPARAGAPKGRVVAMPVQPRMVKATPSNEERIPLGDTGTFGSF